MTITFKFSDGVEAEFEIAEDYGTYKYFELLDTVRAHTHLGKLKVKEEYEK